ncbi:MAG: Ig-like domain-containing protein [Bacteroidales bacterium]|nr:Ig-like domain-containing protein [Bacteroidales bacterium]
MSVSDGAVKRLSNEFTLELFNENNRFDFILSPLAKLYDANNELIMSGNYRYFPIGSSDVFYVEAENGVRKAYTVKAAYAPGSTCNFPIIATSGTNTTNVFAQRTIWYKYITNTSGNLLISNCGTNGSYIEVSAGCDAASIYMNDKYVFPCNNMGSTTVIRNVLPGQEYYIAITGYNPSVMQWSITEQPPVLGVKCNSPATALLGNNILPDSTYSNEFYYKYQATQNGIATLQTCSDEYQSAYFDGVYDACDIRHYNTNNSKCMNGDIVTFEVEIGKVYLFRFNINASTAATVSKPFIWNLSERAKLPGESCGNPIVAVAGINKALPYGIETMKETFYTYHADKDGLVIVSSCNQTLIDTKVFVSDSDCDMSSIITYSGDKCGLQSETSFEVKADSNYYIIWGVDDSVVAPFQWNLTFAADSVLPSGYTCQNPVILKDGFQSVTVDGALNWWEYTASDSGYVYLSGEIPDSAMMFFMDSELMVLESCELTSGIFTSNPDDSTTRFYAEKGMTYKLLMLFHNAPSKLKIGINVIFEKHIPIVAELCSTAKPVVSGTAYTTPFATDYNWYSFKAPENGTIILSSLNYTTDQTVVKAYTSCALNVTDDHDTLNNYKKDDIAGTQTEENYSYDIVNVTKGMNYLISWYNRDRKTFKWDLKFYKSNYTNFVSYRLEEQTKAPVIKGDTIQIEIGATANIEQCTPVFELAPYSSVYIAGMRQYSGNSVDFTNLVEYTMIAADSTAKRWIVQVTQSDTALSYATIKSFKIDGQIGTTAIDQVKKTITAEVSWKSECTNIYFELSPLSTLYTSDGMSMYNNMYFCDFKFNSEDTLFLYAEDGTEFKYMLKVTKAPAPIGGICSNPVIVVTYDTVNAAIDQMYFKYLQMLPGYYEMSLLNPTYQTANVNMYNTECVYLGSYGRMNKSENTSYLFHITDTTDVMFEINGMENTVFTFTTKPLGDISAKKLELCAFNLFNGSTNALYEATIDTINKKIVAVVPFLSNLANVKVSASASVGAKILVDNVELVESGTTIPTFSFDAKTHTLTVVALDGSKVSYTMTITKALPSANAALLSFYVPEQVGESVIDPALKTVKITLPNGLDATALIPYFSVSDGAVMNLNGVSQISGVTPCNLSVSPQYTVVAQNGTNKTIWKIVVIKENVLVSDFTVKDSISLLTGENHSLFINFTPSNASIKSLSVTVSDSSVIDFSQNVIIAKAVGTSKITLTTTDGSAITKSILVRVTELEKFVLAIALPAATEVVTGFQTTIAASIYPLDAKNQSIVWMVADTTIAKVDSIGTIKGINVGTTNITAKALDGSGVISNKCIVTVKGVEVSGVILSKSGTVTLNKGNNLALTATVTPMNAFDKSLIWTSSDMLVAKVDSTGLVLAVAKGSATITATSNGNTSVSASVIIAVTENLVDKSKLQNEILIAQKLKAAAIIGSNPDQYPQAAFDEFKTAINNAVYVYDNTSVSQSFVDLATLKLQDAIVTFENAKVGSIKVEAINIIQDKIITRVASDPIVLKATVTPSFATNKLLKWQVTDSTVLSVSASGEVKALNAGKAYVFAKTTDGTEKSDSCLITVIVPVEKVLIPEVVSVVVATTQQLTAYVLPLNADNKQLLWSSSDTSVVYVTTSGLIYGQKEGMAQVTAKSVDNGKSAVCLVYVTNQAVAVTNVSVMPELTLILGQEYLMSSVVSPIDATNKNVKWTSLNDFVAYVSPSGLLTTFSSGETSVIVTSVDGNKKDTCKVLVLASNPPVVDAVTPIVAPLDKSTINFSVEDFVTDDNTSFSDMTFTFVENDNFNISIVSGVVTIEPKVATWMGTDSVEIVIADNDGIEVTLIIPVTITNASNQAPAIDGLAGQTTRVGGQFTSIYLNKFITDDYTATEKIAWVVDSTNNLNATIIDGYLVVAMVDPEWVGTDSLKVFAIDENGLKDSVTLVYGISTVPNKAPALTEIPRQVQNNTLTYYPVQLSMYVTDDYTMPQNIVWMVGVTNKLNVEVLNGKLLIEVADLYWTGTEQFEIYAYDEDGASDTVMVSFTQEVMLGENWRFAPRIEFAAQPLVAAPNQDVMFNASLTGADTWIWEFADAEFATGEQFKMNPTVKYAKPGRYSVTLKAENTYGSDSLTKTEYITVIGLAIEDSTICEGSSVTLRTTLLDSVTYKYAWSANSTAREITVSPTEQTTYVVTITKGYFSYIDSVTISISDSLNLGTDVSFCQGTSVIVAPEGFVEYNWNNSGWVTDETSYELAAVGELELSVRDALGCTSSDKIAVLEVFTNPVVSLGADIEICNGTSKTIDAGDANKYLWSTGETTKTIAVDTSGAYSVVVTDAHNCTDTDTITATLLTPYAEPLGIATFGETGKSVIVAWERTSGKRTASYIVMRETGATDIYEPIDTVLYTSDSSYSIDRSANALTKSYRYKLVTVDSTCGNKAESTPHRTLHVQNNVSLDNKANLIWEHYEGTTFSTYTIYKASAGSTDFVEIDNVTSNAKTWTSDTEYVLGDVYRVAAVFPTSINPTRFKSDSGPFSQSISNLTEAKLTGLSNEIIMDYAVYPTITQGEIKVFINTDLVSVKGQIVTNSGQIVMSNISLKNGITTIDVSKLAQGIYNLVIETEKGSVTKQIIKN